MHTYCPSLSAIPVSLQVKKKHPIYLAVSKSKCSPTVISLLNSKYSLATALVTRDFLEFY